MKPEKKMLSRLVPLTLLLTACATAKTSSPTSSRVPPDTVPFEYAGGHFLTVPVTVNGTIETRFILDTGIGVTLLSTSLCERVGCAEDGSYTGRRMSGQELRVPLTTIESLQFGSLVQSPARVGVFDLGDELPGVDGILSLTFFESAPFTVDYANGQVILEDEASLAARVAQGASIPIRIERAPVSLVVFLPLQVGGMGAASVEVDTGSNALILDRRFMGALNIAEDAPSVRRAEGEDETGQAYVRFFTAMPVPVHPVGAEALARSELRVMFQKIIHDGLVGHAFLKGFVVTYDLANARMILADPSR